MLEQQSTRAQEHKCISAQGHKVEEHKSTSAQGTRAEDRGQRTGERGQRTEVRGEGREVREWKFLFNSLPPSLYSLYAILSSLTSHLSPLCTIRYLLFALLISYFIPLTSRSIYAWEIVDIPTTEPVDAYTYRLGFRLYSDGGVMTRTTFGVFRNINIGFAWDLKNLIGVKNIEMIPPSVHLKILIYEGSKHLPSFAIGYDGQGYYWNKDEQGYREKEKGVFVVLSREVFTPNLELTAGANVNDFRKSTVHGFAGISYMIEKLSFLIEYDNLRDEKFHRLNGGIRFAVIPELNFEFVGRNMAKSENAERVLKVNYIGRF